MNQNHATANFQTVHMVVAICGAAFLAGCTVSEVPAAVSQMASASPAPSFDPQRVDAEQVTVMTVATPSPGPKRTDMGHPGPRNVDADVAYTNEFLSQAWDTTEATSLVEVSIGDCIFFDYDYTATTTALFTVDCSQPHEGEVLAIYRYHESEYPGQVALWGRAGQAFSDAVDSLREAGWITTGFSYQDLAPTEADWEAGGRTGLTILRHGDSNGLLEGSYLDAERFVTIDPANG
jgi:hypothetical protein